jgi:hypothetical protein
MAHLVADLRQRIVVRRDAAVGRAPPQLTHIEADVVIVRIREAGRRLLLHLIRPDVDGLVELPLESPGAAVRGQTALPRADPCHLAACWTPAEGAVARRARLLIVDTEIGVVGEEVEPVAECPDHRAGEVHRARRLQVVKALIRHGEGTVGLLHRREVERGAVHAGEVYGARSELVGGG